MYQVQHFAKVVEPGTKNKGTGTNLHELVPITLLSMDVLEFFEQILAFNSADNDTNATVTCSGVVWSCPLVSQGTDVDLFSEFLILTMAPKLLVPIPSIWVELGT